MSGRLKKWSRYGQTFYWSEGAWLLEVYGWRYRIAPESPGWRATFTVLVERWTNVAGEWGPDGWEQIAHSQTIRSALTDIINPRHAMKMAPSPGKFEGEPSYAKYYWGAALDGAGEDVAAASGRLVSFFEVERGDRILFPYIGQDTRWVSLWEDDQGFVWSEELTARGKDRVVEDLEAEATEAAEGEARATGEIE